VSLAAKQNIGGRGAVLKGEGREEPAMRAPIQSGDKGDNDNSDNDPIVHIMPLPIGDVVFFEEDSGVPTSTPVEYEVTFQNLWTASRHPNDYPEETAHWSPLVVVTHNENYALFAQGETASIGVRRVAEVRCTTQAVNDRNALRE
jgi:hypothetical protein